MLLFTPGPTPVPEEIRAAMSEKTIHHRTPEFEAIFAQTRAMLLGLYKMDEVLMLASSGSGAMEACLLNLCKRKALTINAGKFGQRFGKICDAYGIDYHELKYEWDTPASVDAILDVLKNDVKIDAICIQISESAGGLRHPVEAIAKEVKKLGRDISIIADGITALGVEHIDATHIDAVIGGSQKAFMLPPGLAFIGLSKTAVEKIGEGRGFYFNLATELKNQQKNTTAWTAPTTLIIGLKKVLEMINEKGIDNLYKETAARGVATRAALEAVGLKVYPTSPAKSMTTIIDERAEDIRKVCKKELGLNMAGGQDHLKGKIFRINHMGLQEVYEASWPLNAIELAMEKLEIRKFDGSANRVFLENYFEVLK